MTTSCVIRKVLFLMMAFACLMGPAQAETVLSNLAETPTDSTSVRPNRFMAQSFTTNNQAWTLTSATLAFDTASFDYAKLWVELHDNGTNGPGAFLGVLAGPDDPADAGLYTYTSTGVNLAPSSTYWLVVGALPGGGTYNWTYVDSDTDPPASVGVWSIPSTNTYATSTDQGESWDLYDLYPQQFKIEATPVSSVPEIDPNSLGSVVALVLGSLGLFERRRLRVA